MFDEPDTVNPAPSQDPNPQEDGLTHISETTEEIIRRIKERSITRDELYKCVIEYEIFEIPGLIERQRWQFKNTKNPHWFLFKKGLLDSPLYSNLGSVEQRLFDILFNRACGAPGVHKITVGEYVRLAQNCHLLSAKKVSRWCPLGVHLVSTWTVHTELFQVLSVSLSNYEKQIRRKKEKEKIKKEKEFTNKNESAKSFENAQSLPETEAHFAAEASIQKNNPTEETTQNNKSKNQSEASSVLIPLQSGPSSLFKKQDVPARPTNLVNHSAQCRELHEEFNRSAARMGVAQLSFSMVHEVVYARLIKRYGFEDVKTAIVGMGYQSKSEKFDPTQWFVPTRLEKEGVFLTFLTIGKGKSQKTNAVGFVFGRRKDD